MSYDKKSVKELRALLSARGISITSKRKVDLIDLLQQDDEVVLQVAEVREEGSSTGTKGETPVDSATCAQLKILEMQLEIEKTKLKQLEINPCSTGLTHSAVATSNDFSLAHIKNRLPVMQTGQETDILQFFTNFERALLINDVTDESLYARLLPACLNQKALSVYSKCTLSQCQNYRQVKDILACNFRLNCDSILKQLNGESRKGNESYSLFLNRLSDLQANYLKSRNIESFDELKDDVLMNIFLNSLPDDVKRFVKGKQPENSDQAAKYSDLHFQIYGPSIASKTQTRMEQATNKKWNRGLNSLADETDLANMPTKSEVNAQDSVRQSTASMNSTRPNSNMGRISKPEIRCYACNEHGHKSFQCEKSKPIRTKELGNLYTQQTAAVNEPEMLYGKYVIPVFINGHKRAHVAYRDTGSRICLIEESLLDDNMFNGKLLEIQGVLGPPSTVRMAEIFVQAPHFKCEQPIKIEVAAMPNLPFGVSLLLGNEMFENNKNISDVVSVNTGEFALDKRNGVDLVAFVNFDRAVETHKTATDVVNNDLTLNMCYELKDAFEGKHGSQSVLVNGTVPLTRHKQIDMQQQQQTLDVDEVSESELDTKATRLDDGIDRPSVPNVLNDERISELETNGVDGDLFDTEFQRLSLVEPGDINHNLCMPQTEQQTKFAEMQRADPKLEMAFKKANTASNGFTVQEGILVKAKPKHIRSENAFLIVLPDVCKAKVLKQAHDSVNSGFHTGYKRTMMKIWRVFYIPKAEIKKYVASCEICQSISPKFKRERAELYIPAIDAEFGKTFVIDVMGGDLNRLSKCEGYHKYVLICVCQFSRWVELFPLPNLKAKTLADVLVEQLVARYRCSTLVFDQQSGLMSQLIASVLKLLRVKANIAVAGYHTKTGLAERTVRTVENCLKPYISNARTNWRAILPWVAFHLRQLPCETTGVSAHEMVFGKNFPDSLEDLKLDLIGNVEPQEKKVKKHVLAYMKELRENISRVREIAKRTEVKSRARTKTLWDKCSTKNKTFEPGSKVIILEPTDSRKLYNRWSEPKEIVRKIGERTYEVRMDDKTTKAFHIDQLRQWNERVDFIASVVIKPDVLNNYEDSFIREVDDDDFEEDGPLPFKVETSLLKEQRDRVLALLYEFADVFRPSLGKTDLITHHIELTDTTPCIGPIYRMAESLKPRFEIEINRLLEAGVLRECNSAYRSPIIAIEKPNKSLRLVCDYKQLNKKTKDDLYPMSDPYDVLTKAAGKKFISKLDLTSAFFQIPLAEDCQEYTAFSCFLGSYCFTRAAQGLRTSPRTMQRLMDKILRGTSKYASALLDDIVISSYSFNDHLVHLREILSKLRAANLTASLSKSEFLMKSMTILGHCLEDGLIKPSQKHIENVLKIGPQTTKAGVRAILGILGYHRHFIPSFAELTYEFTELLKKDQPEKGIKWEKRHTDALEKVKHILTSNPVLVPPRHDRDYIIMSDATDKTVASLLIQEDDDGTQRNVAYFSRKLLPNERNWSVLEKEAYGILLSVLKWHQWVYGHKILALTDHRALEFLDSTAQHNSRIARWKIILGNYIIETRYRRGVDHINCDSLSRIEMPD